MLATTGALVYIRCPTLERMRGSEYVQRTEAQYIKRAKSEEADIYYRDVYKWLRFRGALLLRTIGSCQLRRVLLPSKRERERERERKRKPNVFLALSRV